MRQAIARDGLARNALRITLLSLQAAKARISATGDAIPMGTDRSREQCRREPKS